MTTLALLALLTAAGPGLPAPDGPCGTSGVSEIVVCKRRAPNAESRYRLPLRADGFDPLGGIDSVSRGRGRLLDADGAAPDLSRGSCSAAGASGATGCQIKAWRESDQQKGW